MYPALLRLRVRPAHRDYKLSEPRPEEWLLIEWPPGEDEPSKYWLSTLPESTAFERMVQLTKECGGESSATISRLKQELGLGHYEGRGWRGFHPTMRRSASHPYGFLIRRAGQGFTPNPPPPPPPLRANLPQTRQHCRARLITSALGRRFPRRGGSGAIATKFRSRLTLHCAPRGTCRNIDREQFESASQSHSHEVWAMSLLRKRRYPRTQRQTLFYDAVGLIGSSSATFTEEE